MSDFVELVSPLDTLPGIRAAFLTRVPGINVDADREEALKRLRPAHDAAISELGFATPIVTAEQVHGNIVASVNGPLPAAVNGADGLATATPGVTLGIYVADCAAVFLADRHRRAIALVHSGRKGTEQNIVGEAVRTLRTRYSIDPSDLVVVVAPCIRPPHYEVDFAAAIAAQVRNEGICKFYDAGVCTASNPERYYSYRSEKGRTGRMLALLAIDALATSIGKTEA
jgi:copper oxidase (laccase) domain-containing protein